MTVRKTALHNLAPGLSAEDERLTGGFGLWTPSGSLAGMHAKPGILPGRAGQMGEVTVNSDTSATINPYRAVIPGNQGNYQGDYVVASDAAQALTIGPRQAGVARIDYLVTRVRDTGYAPNEGANDVVASVIAGTPAASNPAPPNVPPNAHVHGYFSVPATGAGSVTYTPLGTFPVALGGVEPIPTREDATPGAYVGQYRDHPSRGLERWNGTKWHVVSPFDAPAIRARRSAVSVPNNAFTTLTWDIEDIDTHDMREAVNPAAFKIKRDGIYQVGFSVHWNVSGTAAGRTALRVYRAAAATPSTFVRYGDIGALSPNGGVIAPGAQARGLMILYANDLIRFDVYQDSGGAMTTSTEDYAPCYAEAIWLRTF